MNAILSFTVAWFRRARSIGFASIGIVMIGTILFETPQTLGQQEKNPSTYAALAEAPEKARRRRNPFEGDTQAVAAGGKLFGQHCAECHGRKAGGARQGPSLQREEVRQAAPGALFWVLSNGVVRRGMPVWSKLPEPERWQIVAFLQSLKPQSLNPQSERPASN